KETSEEGVVDAGARNEREYQQARERLRGQEAEPRPASALLGLEQEPGVQVEPENDHHGRRHQIVGGQAEVAASAVEMVRQEGVKQAGNQCRRGTHPEVAQDKETG